MLWKAAPLLALHDSYQRAPAVILGAVLPPGVETGTNKVIPILQKMIHARMLPSHRDFAQAALFARSLNKNF
jgi:hypothetical protein